jgi:hypothetical protein
MSIYDQHKPANSGGLFLKLQGGDTVKLRIFSEPAIFESVFEKEGEETNISTRYAWLVWNQDEQAAQILQQSASVFNQIAQLARDEDWGDPTEYDVKISREGTGFSDTKYTVNPSPNREPLSEAAKAALSEINLLEKVKSGKGVQRAHMLSEWEEMQAHPKSNKIEAAGSDTKTTPKKDDVVIEDVGDEPVNLDDIPF